MGGYVTQTRSTEWFPLVPHSWVANGVQSTGFTPGDVLFGVTLAAPNQVTTSWRDSTNRTRDRRYDREETMEMPTTLGAAMQYYRSEEAGRGSSPYDNGHTFATVKQWREFSHPWVEHTSPNGLYRYRGPLYANPGSASSQYQVNSAVDFNYYGTRAVAATAPTNPVANLAQMLAEIKREGLPTLFGLRQAGEQIKGLSREAAHEYLNVTFGWKPLISDTVSLMSAIVDANKHIRQYLRNSGKHVRRSYYFPETLTSSDPVITTSSAALCYGTAKSPISSTERSNAQAAVFPSRAGTLTTRTETYRKVWFKGAYSYILPAGVTSQLKRLETLEGNFNHLFGTRLTPELLWNLAPWSWLVDWNWNIGDLLASFQNLHTDGLVIQYGYMMATTHIKKTITASAVPKSGGGVWDPITTTFHSLRKERVRVNPYGFGSNPANYTGRQWAILGALGLTKNPGQLRTD